MITPIMKASAGDPILMWCWPSHQPLSVRSGFVSLWRTARPFKTKKAARRRPFETREGEIIQPLRAESQSTGIMAAPSAIFSTVAIANGATPALNAANAPIRLAR